MRRSMAPKVITADQLLHIPGRCDLYRGELRTMSPPGADHCWVAANITTLLTIHVRAHGLGRVYSNDAGFQLERSPDTVLGPDVPCARKPSPCSSMAADSC